VELSNSIPVDVTVDLWIGMEISGQLPGVNPVGYDAGPAVIGYGDMLSFDGVTWETATTYGLDFNWNLQTYIAPEPDQSKTDQTSINDFTATANSSFQLVYEQTKKTAYPPDAGSRDLLGYNIYRDDIKVNTSIHPGLIYLDGNVPLGQHTYFVTAVYNQGESIPSDAVMINIGMAEQVITLSEGWNGVSSYLLPESPDFESICLSITGNLEFAQNLSGYYYPEFDINTLGDWNEKSGYLFKVNAGCELPITGFTFDDRTVQLYSGWNLIPVLSECEVVTTDLFYGIVGNITVVKDAAGSGIYWPAMNINTIPVMLPGRSYWVKIFSNKTITFPECEN